MRSSKFYKTAETIQNWISAFPPNPFSFVRAVRGFPSVFRDYLKIKNQNKKAGNPFSIRFSIPQLRDRFESGGTAKGAYFHQDLLVARRIFERRPLRHIDVGSRVDGFVAHVAAFRRIEVLDIRPVPQKIHNIDFVQCDVMNPNREFIECADSVSCLHALEHFGLGRYGDPVDLHGYVKGVLSLTAMLKPGGVLYLSVPICGNECVAFNAHRIFNPETILDLASKAFDLISFSYVDDKGELFENVKTTPENIASGFGCRYGCEIFEFRKVQKR